MTLKKTVRAFAKVARQIERDSQRRSRVAAQQYKRLQKEQAIASAAEAVNSYNDYIHVLKSVHHDCNDSVDWKAMQCESSPTEPSPCLSHEVAAQRALDTCQPSFFDRLLKRGPVKVQRLEQAVADARLRDQDKTEKDQVEYINQLSDWRERQELARRVLLKDTDAYEQAIDIFNPFDSIDHINKLVDFIYTADHIEVDLHINSSEVIPDFALSQLASGKLSRKTLPISKFNELYQDYVCSCILRIGREIQAHLPVDQVVVHAFSNQLNSATGIVEPQLIVSVSMPRSSLNTLNFVTLDPSDSMRNFIHAMKFTKTAGFQAVKRVGLAAPLPRNRPS